MTLCNRRQLLAWSAFASAHLGLSGMPLSAAEKGSESPPRARLRRVHLKTRAPETLLPFYRDQLELPAHLDGSGLSVRIGESELVFSEGQGQPFYHFAFNIPENKLDKAMRWLEGRSPLLVPSWQEGPVVHFENWDAHSVYFADPAGNILEFIAHHPLPNAGEGDFLAQDMLYVSEIGLVVNDMSDTLERFAKIDLTPYKPPYESFAAVGDPYGLFILVTRGRVWLPTDDVLSEVHAAEVDFLDREGRELVLPDQPYRLRGSAD